ncbi:MAG: TonB-dependent receptor [Bryobacteraceae bacterium]
MLVFALCAAPFLSFPRLSFGQAAAINGQIEGTIADPSGAVVPRAAVDVLNEGTGFTRHAETDESGFFRFTVLPLGNYTVSVRASGFAPARSTGIALSAGSTVTLDVPLQLGATSVDFVVTGDAPVVEPGRTDLGSTLSGNEIANLPLVSRNNFNYILVQPNVSGHANTEFGVPRKINANGFTDRINYQLDGSNNTESDRAGIRLMPISNTWIEEVQQVSNGFAPEFGNTVGTVFNAITKSGTNALHGEAGYLFRRTDFSARSPLLKPTDVKPTLNVDDFFADAAGGIVKDKLFFFGSFEHVKRDLPQPVTITASTIAALGLPAGEAQPIPFSQSNYFYLGKIDYQIDAANRLSGKFTYFQNESPFNASTFVQTLVSQTYLFKDRAPAYSAQLISTLSSNAVNELRFQNPKRYQRQVAFEGTGPQPVLFISGVANFGGSDQIGLRFIEITPEVSDNFSYNLRTHSFKVGTDVRAIRDDNTIPLYAKYTFASVADYLAAKSGASPSIYTNYTQYFGNPQVKYNSLFTSIYAQDNWKARRNITVNYGVRYDLYEPPGADKSSPFATSRDFNVSKKNFAPRAGIAYTPGKDQKTVFRLNGGIFYDPPQTDLYRRALLNNGNPRFFALSIDGKTAFSPQFPSVLTSPPTGFNLPVQDITGVAPDFRTFYSTNANFQVTREITSNLGISATYLYTKGTHLPVYRNLNPIPSGLFLADGRPKFGTGRLYPQFNNVLVAESVGNSNYNGLNVTLTRRFARGYEFFGTYTWSHAIDDAPEQNVIDSSALLPSDPSNRRRDRGNSITDRRHAFTASGVLNPRFSIDSRPMNWLINHNNLSFIMQALNGDVFNIGGNRNLNGDQSIPASLQRPLFTGRNTVRGPNIYELNLRYSRLFPIRERVNGEFFGEFTNLLNHSNITGLNTTASVDAQGFVLTPPSLARTAALDPRLMQLGFRVSF